MATSTSVTTDSQGNKTTTKTHTPDPKPGDAWVKGTGKNKNKWVRPEKPTGDYAWDDKKGWVSKAAAANDYGYALAVINSDKELTKLFNRAWSDLKNGQEWSEGTFKIELHKTKWFINKSEKEQLYYTLSHDPSQKEEFQRQVNNNTAVVNKIATSVGATLTPEQMNKLSKDALRLGWNDQKIEQVLHSYVQYTVDPKTGASALFGKSGQANTELRDWAKRNGVKLDDEWFNTQLQQAANNDYDVSKAKDYITNVAKRRFTPYADLIDSTTTAQDAAAGIINSVSVMHEVPLGQVDITDSRVQRLMSMTNEKNQPMNTFEVEKWLRQQPEWANTKNAKETSNGLVNNILSRWGF